MDEIDYDDDIWETWKRSGPTNRLIRLGRERERLLAMKLEAAARHSTDADVRGAHAELASQRTMLAELQGLDQVGGGQQ